MAKNKIPEFPTLIFINKAIAMRKAQVKYLRTRSQADDDIRIAAEAEFDEAVATWEAANKAVMTFKPSIDENDSGETADVVNP